MHNISTECLFSFITNPPEDIHRKSTGIPPEIHRKSTGMKDRNLLSFGVRRLLWENN